ncbi:MAG: hypothetical protein ACFFCS_30110, partial [Candidatus Hodarchaeota archaeon]
VEIMNKFDIFEQFKAKNKKVFEDMGVDVNSYEFSIRVGSKSSKEDISKFLKDLPKDGSIDTSLKGMTSAHRVQTLESSGISQNLEGTIIQRSKNFILIIGIAALGLYTFFMLFL